MQASQVVKQKQRKNKLGYVMVGIMAAALLYIVATSKQSPLEVSAKQAISTPEKITTSSVSAEIASSTAFSNVLQNAWSSILATRQGDVDIAVYNGVTKQTAHYSKISTTYNTASIVKLSILEEQLVKDQKAGTGLTGDQLAYAVPMIEQSDNDSATALWKNVGDTPAMQTFFNQIGASSTTASKISWGITQTTALDQLKVLNTFAYPNGYLTDSSVAIVNGLLDNVSKSQKWGVSAGVPAGATVRLKNGWLPDAGTGNAYTNTNNWTVNSIGHIQSDNTDYTIAILSSGNPNEQYGINTLESLSAATWSALQ